MQSKKNKHFLMNKKIPSNYMWIASFGVLFTSLYLGSFYLVSKSYSVWQSEVILRNFVKQNKIEVANVDVVALESRLNSLSALAEIKCIVAQRGGQVFYDYRRDVCETNRSLSKASYLIPESGIQIDVATSLSGPQKLILLLTYLITYLFALVLIFLYRLFSLERADKQRKLVEIATQVAHDIRSPLTALNLVANQMRDGDEDKRSLLINATKRINDIANDLLRSSKKSTQTIRESARTLTPVDSFLENLVSEKRIQLRDRSSIKMNLDLSKSHNLLIEIVVPSVQRAVSNILNNAIEAVTYIDDALVGICAYREGNEVVLAISDNGAGIPTHVLSRLGARGVTYGKGNSSSGSGLGYHQAQLAAVESGGKLIIKTSTDVPTGTTIEFRFPLSKQ